MFDDPHVHQPLRITELLWLQTLLYLWRKLPCIHLRHKSAISRASSDGVYGLREMSEEDTIVNPHALALAQAYFEYRSILSQEEHASATEATKSCCHQVDEGGYRILPSPTESIKGGIKENHEDDGNKDDGGRGKVDPEEKKDQHEPDQQDKLASVGSAKRLKLSGETSRKHPPEWGVRSRSRASPTTSLRNLRAAAREGTDEVAKNKSWDIFVLVVQNSGLHHVSSKRGHDVGVTTLLVADPTSSLLRVTLWMRAAKLGAELIQAGDLVRINRCGTWSSVFSCR